MSSYLDASNSQPSLMTVSCPQCKTPVILQQSKERPFCSKRCKLIDRGAWASGEYNITSEPSSKDSSCENLSYE